MRDLAVVGCSELVTLAGPDRPRTGHEMRELGIIRQGAMLIRNGCIDAIGPREEIERQMGGDCEVLDVQGRVVMPGFVDAHTHLIFAGNRADEFEQRTLGKSYQEIATGGGGIQSTVAKTRAASEDELAAIGKRHAGWFLRTGTTTIEAKSGYGLTVEDELKILRAVRRVSGETPLDCVPTFLGAHAVPCDSNPADYQRLVMEEMLPRVAAEGLAEYCDVFCEPGYFDIAPSRAILAAARLLGFGLRMHADQLTLSGGAHLAAEMGAATADHLEQTELVGMAAMKAAGVQPVLLPGSVYALGQSKYPDARKMIDLGLAVVLATDFNPGSSPTPSMPMILSLACTKMKMTPAEAIVASTINAACSLNRGHDRGSLEPGKRADFSVFDCQDHREIPYYFGIELALAVYVRGERAATR